MKGMNIIQLNTLHLNVVPLNGKEMPGEVVVGGGEVVPVPPTEPETPDVPDVPVEPKKFILSASVANGVVSATLNGVVVSLPYTANEGDVIIVEVTPNDGYSFEGWADGNTDNPRSITMNADVALSAQCVEVVAPPVGKYIQFEDKAVEAICVANWSSDGIGLTEEDAAKVTDIGIIFRGNSEITSFEEFRYFTGVQKIGHKENETYGAFKGCTNLRSIALPDSCYSIGCGAFGDCTSLTSITYGNVTEIGSRAFRNCTSLGGELSFPYLTTLKGDGFFAGTKITSFSAPLLTSIPGHSALGDYGAFANCSALANIDIPSVVNIGPHTFYKCTSLGVVELLVVTGIGNAAFHSCTNLQSVLVRTSTPPTLGSNVFYGSTCPIYVPDASLEAYKTAVNWSAYADRIHPLSEIEGDDSRLDYIHDSMLMWLDGIDKGTVEGEWQDLVGNNNFVNYGAVELANGYQFNGESYMQIVSDSSHLQWSDNTTLEVVVEFAGNNTYDAVLISAYNNGVAFGRTPSQLIVASNNERPAYADPLAGYAAGKVVVAVNKNTALYNGYQLATQGPNYFGGQETTTLGKWQDSFLKGKIHAIRIHNRILSEEEILYNQRIDNKRFNLGLDI